MQNILRTIPAIALIAIVLSFGLPAASADAAKHLVVGDSEITINGEPYEEKIFVNGKLAYDNADGEMLNVTAQFETDNGNTLVFFLECSSGGTACPALYRFIFAASDGHVSISDSFGTCSDLPELRISPEKMIVVIPNMDGAGASRYRIQNKKVIEVK
ncbi:MAG: hypothetical protein LBT59_21340 [Clostridiales bacterium]|nr:hypothetical protein [Clostridiales bacterium]